MHVRVAWEIYHHQAKQNPEKASSVAGVKPESMLRPHMYPPPSPNVARPHEMQQSPSGFPNPNAFPGRSFDSLTANFLGSPSSHLGKQESTKETIEQNSNLLNNYRSFSFRTLCISIRFTFQWTVSIRERYAHEWTDS